MKFLVLSVVLYLGATLQALGFNHAAYDQLLKSNVTWINPSATEVDYAALMDQQARLQAYLSSLAAVKKSEFNTWPKPEQLAFLINAYNAYTLELILDNYPEIDSIKDIGGFFGSPWDIRFAELLGGERTLDEIEHKMIRTKRFSEPRIHFAVNCASVGCPALRDEAYTAAKLEAQLKDQTRRFLADRSRNELDGDTLTITPLFKWYSEDFRGSGGGGVRNFLADYPVALGLSKEQKSALLNGKIKLRYSDYDWSLNDKR